VDGIQRDEFACSECGDPTDDGEGWDGRCGNCADALENEHEADDHDRRFDDQYSTRQGDIGDEVFYALAASFTHEEQASDWQPPASISLAGLDRKEREERLKESTASAVDELCDLINQGATQDFLEAMAFYGKLWKYSRTNQMLIRFQRPDASLVAGYTRWSALGRQVRLGSQGIWIWAPVTKKREDANGKEFKQVVGFRSVCVFAAEDLEDIEDQPLPELWPKLPDDVEDLYQAVIEKVRDRGFTVDETDLTDGAQGMANTFGILVQRGLDSRNRLAVLLHETAHMLAHIPDPKVKERLLTQIELEAEASAFIVLKHLGVSRGDVSRNYLCNWKATAETLTASLDTINKIVKEIILMIEGIALEGEA
jgi:hypothetical protein